MKKQSFIRILSFILAFTILFSDISAYAASEVSQTEEVQQEDTPQEVEQPETIASDYIAQGTYGDSITWSIDEKGTLVIDGEGAMTDGECLLEYRPSITRVVVNEGITSIGFNTENNFGAIENALEIILPESLERIEDYAFNNCYKLERIVIPNNVTSIGVNAFRACSNIMEVVLPDDLESIGDYAFVGCSSLENIVIPETVSEIGDWAFGQCGVLKSISIPKNVKRIGEYTFGHCVELENVELSEGIETIEDSAFRNCPKLENIVIPGSVRSIGSNAFKMCSGLKTVDILHGTTSIGTQAFVGCRKLESVKIPKSVTYLGTEVFGEEYIPASTALVIYCHYGSAAYKYAASNSISRHIYSYQVAFHDNYGLGGEPLLITLYFGEEKPLLDGQTFIDLLCDQNGGSYYNKDLYYGYEIERWTTEANGGTSYDVEDVIPEPDAEGAVVHLFARWKKIDFHINYHLNGGINSSANPSYYQIGWNQIILRDPERPYYEFAGWYRNAQLTSEPVYDICFEPYRIIADLYAKWIPIEYKITYDLDGGHFNESETTSYNVETETISLLTPVKLGYRFEGWYDNDQFEGNKITEIHQGSNGDKKFYAKWIKEDYKITYHLDGGENHSENPEIFDVYSSFELKEPSKKGYIFEGWYREADLSGDRIENISTGTAENVALYAKWTCVQYEISYVLNGGIFDTNVKTSYSIEDATIKLPEPRKLGYQFKGWYINSQLSGELIDEIPEGSIGNQTFYAKWKKEAYSITYYLDGGDNHSNNPNGFDVHEEVILKEPSKVGYTFQGWYQNKEFSGNKIEKISVGTAENIELYAKWKINTYTILYKVCGGSLSGQTSVTYTVHDSVQLGIPTRKYYNFAGWYLDETYQGDAVENIQKGTVGNYVFYAKWEPIECSITYHLNGGDNHPDNEKTSYTCEDEVLLLEPSKIGYSFTGWYEDESCTINKVEKLPNKIVEDKDLYAGWKIINYSIDYELNGGEEIDSNPSNYTVEDAIFFNSPVKNGYEFKGWTDSKGNYITQLSPGTTGNIKLFANWEVNYYSITYELNGGNLTETAEKFYTINDYVDLKYPTKEGYEFQGWYDNAELEGERRYTIPSGQTGNKVFYAKWTANTYYIYYSLGAMDAINSELNPETFTSDEVADGIILEAPTWKYRKFEGWYESSDFDGEAIERITEYKNTRLYAKWSLAIDEFTINLPVNNFIYEYEGYGWKNYIDMEIDPQIIPNDFSLDEFVLRYSIYDSNDNPLILNGYCSDKQIYLYLDDIKAGTYKLELYIYDYYSKTYAYSVSEEFTVEFERREYPINQEVYLNFEKNDSNSMVFRDIYPEIKESIIIENISEKLYPEVGEKESDGTIFLKDTSGELIDSDAEVKDGTYTVVFKLDNPGDTFFEEVETTITLIETGIRKINGKAYLYDENGMLMKGYSQHNGKSYYSDKNGVLQSGWLKVNNVWKYFDQTGSFYELDYETTDGYLHTLENGAISYFSNKTTLLKNSWLTYGGARYFFDEDGFAVKDWHQDGTYWYYADETGKMANKETTIGEYTYYFDSSYRLGTGWKKINGIYRYFNIHEDHEMCYEIAMDATSGWVNLEDERRAYVNASSGPVKGWQTISGYRYHFDNDGFLDMGDFQDGRYFYYAETKETATPDSPIGNVVKGVREMEGEVYGFHPTSYYRLTGWQTLNGKRYFFQDNYTAVKGWYREGNYWYYGTDDGSMAIGANEIIILPETEEQEEIKHTYYFDNSYHLATGWMKINNVWRFFDKKDEDLDCYEITYTVKDGWLIFDEDDARRSYINTSNTILKGWQTIAGQRYYFDTMGMVQKGWFQVGSNWYYGEPEDVLEDDIVKIQQGTVAKGRKLIGEDIYCFHTSNYNRLTGWQTVDGKRYYLDEEGKAVKDAWYQEGDYWYYADENGAMAKDLVSINGKEYCFDGNYRLVTGWKRIGNTMYFFDSVAEQPEACYALVKTDTVGDWVVFPDGRKSYINAKYQLLTGWQTIGGKRYYFDSSGVMQTGLFQVDRYYYYAQEKESATENVPEGSIATGIREIDGKIYGFHTNSYYRLSGWQTIGGKRYYFKDDCSAVIGWYQEGDYWYYAGADGAMLKGAHEIVIPTNSEEETECTHTYYFDGNYRLATGWIKIDNVWRFFDKTEDHLGSYEITYSKEDGWITLNEENPRKSYVNASNSLLKGWQTISGQRYYFDSVGMVETGWFQVGSSWYYADADGVVAKGIKEIDGETYCFHTNSYYRLSGWQTVNGKRFYLDTEGKAKTGPFEVSGKTYFAETVYNPETGVVKGQVAVGAKLVDGKLYVFHSSQYYRLTGWQTVNGKRYYIEENGEALVSRWYQEGDYWYYALADGAMAKGRVPIGDKYYFFDNNYRLSTGWKRIGDTMYYFDSVAEHPEACYELASVTNPNGWVLINENKKSYINAKYQVLTGFQTIGGERYYFESDGVALTGEFQNGRYHYYAETSGEKAGALAKNIKIIDGKIYGFHATQYYRLTGWQTLENARYYFKDDCSAATGWFKVDNDWYYADEDGKVRKDVVELSVGEENKNYYFDGNYRLKTGWIKIGTQWRFFQVSEKKEECYELTLEGVTSGWATLVNGKKAYIHSKNGVLKGFQTIDNVRYYFDSTGIMQTGWFTDGTYWYYADETGCVLKNIQTIDEKNYYFDGNYRLTSGWIKTGTEWHFFHNSENHLERYELESSYENGWLTIVTDGRKSYVNASGSMLKGWQTIDGQRYYFDTAGVLQTGWYQVGSNWYYGEVKAAEGTQEIPEGVAAKGVKVIDGKIYGFHTTGYYRLSGWQIIDSKRYYFDENYQAVTGWYQEGDYWYYADENGCMAKDVTRIGDKEYYFDGNYRLGTGWKRIGNTMYFFAQVAENPRECYALIKTETVGCWITFPDQRKSYINTKYQVLTGWQTIEGKRYYFDSMGIMTTGLFQVGRYEYYAEEAQYATEQSPEGSIAVGIKEIDGKIYGFHSSQYYRLSGWQTIGGKKYYFQDDCSAITGWYQEGTYWYYAAADGSMVKGAVEITIPAASEEETSKKNIYYFDGNHRLATGWIKIDNVWRFFDKAEKHADCHEITYTTENGWISLNEENPRKSYVNASNSLLKGWQTISGQRYYFDSIGFMETGWFQVGTSWYYADANGVVAKGIKEIDGETYCFHTSSYYRLTGWQTISGKRFYLDSEGKAKAGIFEVSGKTYYAEPASNVESGVVKGQVVTGAKFVDGKLYVFNTSQYYRLTGWQTISGQRYYLREDGSAVVNAWYQEGDYWYHANANGQMAKGRTLIDGKWYYFDGNYRLSTGWKREGNTMYFYDFVSERPELCYELASVTNPNGWVVISEKKRSYINSKYQVLTGWQTIDKQKYYFDSTGIALIGEFQVGRYYYYANPTGENIGALAANAVVIGGKVYGFHPSQYYRLTGWQTLSGKRYYFQNDCSAVIGWHKEGNYWYYAQTDGSILKGEQKLSQGDKTYYFDNNYRLVTGWVKDGTEWKFFNIDTEKENCYRIPYTKDGNWANLEDGRRSYIHSKNGILKGWQTIDGARYYFDSTGIMQTGWYHDGTYWYYLDEMGKALKGIHTIDGKEYNFDGNYRVKPLNSSTGWKTVGGKKYYYDAFGELQIGWFHVGNYWYYATSTGSVVSGTLELKVGEERKIYHFDENYRLQTGWQTINGKRYYIEISESPENYKITCIGTVKTGWQTMEGGRIFYGDKNGNIKTGWQTIDGKRYYFDAAGILQTGWFTVSGKTYYGEEASHDNILIGTIAQGAKTINGETYLFHSSQYYMLTGFQSYGGKRFYLMADGKAQSGWFSVGTDLYYGAKVSSEGVLKGTLAAGAQEIDGETYFFHTSSNYRLTGWQAANGKRYYLDMDGTAKTGWFTISGKIYYGEPQTADGILKGTAAAGAKDINGNTYVFHGTSNYRLTGWQTANGQRYYLDSDGKAKTDWFTISGKRYYGEPDTKSTESGNVLKGTVAKGKVLMEGTNTYYFHTSQYYMLTGWQTIDKQRHYFDTDGVMKIGWFQVSGYDHYANENGFVLSGLQDSIYHKDLGVSKTYYFDSNYRLKTGWQTVGGKRYFFENADRPEDCYKTNTANVIGAGWFELQNGQLCYADANGNIKTGWQTIDKQRYYFDANGVLQTGWFKVGNNQYYGEPKVEEGKIQEIPLGAVAKGIKEIDGETYCFHTSSYYMLNGWQTISGQRFYLETDQNGKSKAKTGWFTLSGKTYYADSTGVVAKGAVEIEDETYVFHSSQYYMLTGFQSYNGKRYYLNGDGTAKTGWFAVGIDRYYGELTSTEDTLKGTLASGAKEIGGKTYFFHISSNYRLTGWQTVSGKRFYLDEQGVAKTGWFTVGGKIYYGEPESNNDILKGTLASGAKTIDGKVYVFHGSSNYRLTGWQTANKQRYYLQSDGRAKTGWFTLSGKTYYGDPLTGIVAAGMQEIDGATYCFHTSSYYMLTGWQTISGQRFYLETDQNGRAKAKIGWFTLSGKTYYADNTGVVSKGAVEIAGETYFFHSSQYYMLTGFQSYGGKRYYLQKDGTAKTGWFTVGTDLYYGEPEGTEGILKGTLASGAKEIDKKTYFFHTSSNYRLTGWQTVNGQRYYLNADGTAKTGWFTISGKIYYGDPETRDGILRGTLAKGAKEINGETYCFHTSSNYRLTGWQTVNKQRYYLDKDGTAKTGWFTLSGKKYFAKEETDAMTGVLKGTVAYGLTAVDTENYYFHTSQYYMLTGWQTISNQRYYFDTDGKMETGWFEVGGYFYYAKPEGPVVKGLVSVPYGEAGVLKKYYFDNNYRLKTGWQTISNKKYFFENAANPWDCFATVEGYEIETGWITLENGQICYTNSKGAALIGWQTIDKQRYYFDANGVLQTGWFKVGNNQYYGEPKVKAGDVQEIPLGAVAKGIKEIEGKTYCFHTSSYYMLTGWQTVSGKRFYLETGENGKATAKTSWFTLNNKTYYAKVDGEVVKGSIEIDGETYIFHSSQYYMLTGFQSYGGKRYYLQKNGTARTGWFTVGTDLYYGEPEGQDGILKGTLASGAKEIDQKTYFFHTSSNYRLTGWQTANSQRYYLDRDGIAKTGWFTISGKIYYGEPETKEGILRGTLAKGAKEVGGETYLFHTSSYYRLTGWQSVNKQRYYLDKDGKAKTGWFTLSGKRYYGEPVTKTTESGTVLKGTVLGGKHAIGMETYYFHTSQYYMLTGWQTISGQRYYFDASGKMETGWFEVGGYDYYANPDGTIVKGLVELPYGTEDEKKYYYFDNNYRLKTGWYTINSKKYFFTNAEKPEDRFATYEGSVSYGWMTMENGQICYADSKGNIKTGWQTISGRRYYFDANAVLQTGWFKVGNYQYYGEPKAELGQEQEIPIGAIAQGTKEIDGETYLFHSSQYYMLTGFQSYGGKRYYLDKDGTAKTGWFTIGTDLYYGEPESKDGILKGSLASGAKEISGKTYFFHTASNYRLTGWQTVSGQRYYLEPDGTAKTGWFIVGGLTYYAEPETTENGVLQGTLAKGAKEIDGETYFFHSSNNNRLTGWQTINKVRYYLQANGKAKSGWFKQNGYWYYGAENSNETLLKGAMESGIRKIGEHSYYFDGNYRLATGWKLIGGVRYFFNTDANPEKCNLLYSGPIFSGWFEFEDGGKAYINLQGNPVTGWQTIGGKKYYFDANGIMQTGWYTINGVDYLFDSDGVNIPVKDPTATSAVISDCYIVSGSRTGGIKVRLQASLSDLIRSADEKFYIVETESYGNAIDLDTPVAMIEKDLEIDTTFTIDARDGSEFVRECVDQAIMNKFALAVLKNDGSYQVISTPMGITNPEVIAENQTAIFKAHSKKGIQGILYAKDYDKQVILTAEDGNTKHTLFNVSIKDHISNGAKDGFVAYQYKGKTYYFSDFVDLKANVSSLNAGYSQRLYGEKGRKHKVAVTFCLLLEFSSSKSYLIDPAARQSGHKYYTLNVREERGRETYEAFFHYMGEVFGQEDCYVTNWILGNEVNSSRAWNYQGSLSQDAYMQCYATAFRLLYNGVKTAKSGNNVFISLDNGWIAAPDTYSGKSTLDKFAAYAQKENKDMLWSIAWHGYSHPLTKCDFWNDNTNTTFSTSTKYISMKNISVLTDYAASLEQKYNKPAGSIRVILSEQGYNFGQGAEVQAEALAWGYYMAEFNDRIDAFIIRAVMDDLDEISGGLFLGLRNRYEEKRAACYVYQFMDSDLDVLNDTPAIQITEWNESKAELAKEILCEKNWSSRIPGFDKDKLANMD